MTEYYVGQRVKSAVEPYCDWGEGVITQIFQFSYCTLHRVRWDSFGRNQVNFLCNELISLKNFKIGQMVKTESNRLAKVISLSGYNNSHVQLEFFSGDIEDYAQKFLTLAESAMTPHTFYINDIICPIADATREYKIIEAGVSKLKIQMEFQSGDDYCWVDASKFQHKQRVFKIGDTVRLIHFPDMGTAQVMQNQNSTKKFEILELILTTPWSLYPVKCFQKSSGLKLVDKQGS